MYQNIGAVFGELAAEEEVHEVDLSDDVDEVEKLAEEEFHCVELENRRENKLIKSIL